MIVTIKVPRGGGECSANGGKEGDRRDWGSSHFQDNKALSMRSGGLLLWDIN